MDRETDPAPTDYRRPNDHLVEPFFGGLGMDGDEPQAEEPVSEARGPLAWLRRLFGARRPR